VIVACFRFLSRTLVIGQSFVPRPIHSIYVKHVLVFAHHIKQEQDERCPAFNLGKREDLPGSLPPPTHVPPCRCCSRLFVRPLRLACAWSVITMN